MAASAAGSSPCDASSWSNETENRSYSLAALCHVSFAGDRRSSCAIPTPHVTTELFRKHGATHMVEWADYDADGAIDLAFGNNNPEGRNGLFRNLLPATQAARSLQVRVLDANARSTRAGAEVRLYAAGTRKCVGSRIVSTGGGYTSQGQTPVHFGLGDTKRVDVEVTGFTTKGRKVTRVANVDPAKMPGRILVVKLPR